MRLWSIHPECLDPAGLVALWREALLAQKVLLGQTKGYKAHPQLQRFRASADPVLMIGCYLDEVAKEASRRHYRFDESKIVNRTMKGGSCPKLPVQQGQIAYEWAHLLTKLQRRSPQLYETYKKAHEQAHKTAGDPKPHPLFAIVAGGVEDWERL